jgi:HAD superfamily hydrolase (TIGR01509 family)
MFGSVNIDSARAAQPNRRLGLVTNGPAEVQTAKIELLELRPYFDFALISGVFGFWKPDRQIFEEALSLGAAQPSETVMIGDSPEHDMAGAEAAGILTIWIDSCTISSTGAVSLRPDCSSASSNAIRRRPTRAPA